MSGSDRLSLKGLVLLILSFTAFGLEFSFTAPTSCDNLNVSWSGGKGPFSLLITPVFYLPQNISIPDSAVDPTSGNGSFSVRLDLAPGRQFLLTMSDSTGFEAGGTSDVLTVGSSVSGTSCNTADPAPNFFFQLNSALQQCRTFTFSGYDNATRPVRIVGLIPLGQSFELHPPKGPSIFNWIADVPTGTSITFIMTDALGRQGGSSDLRTVGISDDSSCIGASSPHSTAQASSSPSGDAQATQTVQIHAGSKTGAIAGATAGGLVLVSLGLLVSSLCCFRRRKQVKHDPPVPHRPPIVFIGSRPSRTSRVRSSLIPSIGRTRRAHSSFDLLPPAAMHESSMRNLPLHQSTLPISEAEYMPSPYILPSEAGAVDGHSGRFSTRTYPQMPLPSVPFPPAGGTMNHARSYSRSHSRSETDGQLSLSSTFSNPHSQGHAQNPSVPYCLSSMTASVTSPKTTLGGTSRTTPRFVLHTDADDVGSVDEEDSMIELPPQYTDRRVSNAKVDEHVKRSDRSPS